MDKFDELRQEYSALEAFPEAWIGDKSARSAFKSYYLAASMRIWNRNKLYSEDYASALHAISDAQYSMEQIVTAMSCCGAPERELLIPEFYKEIVEGDAQTGTEHASHFVEKLNSLLTATALINGDFTVDEANEVSKIIGALVAYASGKGICITANLDSSSKVTPLAIESYLQNKPLEQAAAEETMKRADTKEEKPESEGKTEPISIPITLNISSITLSQNAPENAKMTMDLSKDETLPEVTSQNLETEETLESLLAELDGLVGLAGVKKDVHSLMNFITVSKLRQERGMKVPTISYHLVFTGNPGTGKTTIARLIAKLYYQIGILPKGQLVETDRSALVAGYLGQTGHSAGHGRRPLYR